MCRKEQGYASDLTDEQWAWLEPIIPRSKWGRPLEIDMRAAINGMFYVLRTAASGPTYRTSIRTPIVCTIIIENGVEMAHGH